MQKCNLKIVILRRGTYGEKHYILPKGYTAQEIREVEEQCTIPSFTNLPSWRVAFIEDVIHDLNVGFQKYLDAIGSYIEVEE